MARPRSTPSSSSSDSSGGVKARVLLDGYSWHDEFGNTDSPVHTASKGDEINVSQEEYDRAQDMVPRGLANASEDNPLAADDTPTIPSDLSELSDDELRTLAAQLRLNVDADATRDELVGAVAAAPGGYERPNQ